MKKNVSLFLTLSAGGMALLTLYRQRRREDQARVWSNQVEGQPGTALITGASSGIGVVFARALARQGFNLILVARRRERLQAVADELEAAYPVQAEVLSADLTDPIDLERVAARIAEVPDLDLLVNNAGFGTGGYFAEIDLQPELQMIRLHIIASMRLIRAALPGMIQRGRGGIINVSSVAGLIPLQGNATYGASKSYLNFFTHSLNMELTGTGVRVEALCPGFTVSEFHDVNGVDRSAIPSFLWSRAEDVVAEALKGLREGREIVVPGRIYSLLAYAVRFLPVGSLAQIVQNFRMKKMGRAAATQPGRRSPHQA